MLSHKTLPFCAMQNGGVLMICEREGLMKLEDGVCLCCHCCPEISEMGVV